MKPRQPAKTSSVATWCQILQRRKVDHRQFRLYLEDERRRSQRCAAAEAVDFADVNANLFLKPEEVFYYLATLYTPWIAKKAGSDRRPHNRDHLIEGGYHNACYRT